MKKKFINIACLGAGKHALKNTIPALLSLKKYKLIAIHKRNIKKDNKSFKNFKCKLLDDLDKTIEIKSLDAVYISSPPSLHYMMAKKALISNKHVLVEKPAVINFKQAKILRGLANKNKLIIMEAFMYKFHDQFIYLLNQFKKIKNKKKIKIVATFGFPHLEKTNFRYSHKAGGGALLDVGTYTISALRCLTDDKLILKDVKINRKKFHVDVNGFANFKSIDGLTLKANWFFGRSYKNQIIIKYENKYISVNRVFSKPIDLITSIDFYKDNEFIKSIKINKQNHFKRMFNLFYSSCTDENFESKKNDDFYIQSKILDEVLEMGKKN